MSFLQLHSYSRADQSSSQLLYTPQMVLSLLTATAYSKGAGHMSNAGIIHALSWVAQFLGHGLAEKRAPALVDNLLGGEPHDFSTNSFSFGFWQPSCSPHSLCIWRFSLDLDTDPRCINALIMRSGKKSLRSEELKVTRNVLQKSRRDRRPRHCDISNSLIIQ